MTAEKATGPLDAAQHVLSILDPDAPPAAIQSDVDWLSRTDANGAAGERVMSLIEACDFVRSTLPGPEIRHTLDVQDHSARFSLPRLPLSYLAAAVAATALCILSVSALVHAPFFGSAEVALVHRYATDVGERSLVRLSDGSVVELGGASSISVRFSREQRTIELADGEAFFTVAHDPARPFIVATRGGNVRAIGTRFNVHSTATGVSVGVAQGHVRVSARGGGVDLLAGAQLSYTPGGEMSPVEFVDPASIGEWRKGILDFRDEPLARVVADLNRYSGRRIVIGDYALGLERITGKVHIDNVEGWLAGLGATGFIAVSSGPDATITLHFSRTDRVQQTVR